MGAFGLALSASDLLKVGSFIANRVHSDECLTDYYSGDGIVAGGDKDGLANWRKHSWVNPKNLNQFGGMGYGGQVLMFDTKPVLSFSFTAITMINTMTKSLLSGGSC